MRHSCSPALRPHATLVLTSPGPPCDPCLAAGLVKSNSSLTNLSVADNVLRAKGAATVTAAMRHAKVVSLDLSGNDIGAAGAHDVGHQLAISHSSLTAINLDGFLLPIKKLRGFVPDDAKPIDTLAFPKKKIGPLSAVVIAEVSRPGPAPKTTAVLCSALLPPFSLLAHSSSVRAPPWWEARTHQQLAHRAQPLSKLPRGHRRPGPRESNGVQHEPLDRRHPQQQARRRRQGGRARRRSPGDHLPAPTRTLTLTAQLSALTHSPHPQPSPFTFTLTPHPSPFTLTPHPSPSP